MNEIMVRGACQNRLMAEKVLFFASDYSKNKNFTEMRRALRFTVSPLGLNNHFIVTFL